MQSSTVADGQVDFSASVFLAIVCDHDFWACTFATAEKCTFRQDVSQHLKSSL